MTEIVPTQEFELRADTEGVIELTTVFRAPISSLVLYFPSNFGGDNTIIRYIGMQGEHTHYRREAVDTVYEVLCNGQDIVQPEEQAGSMSHSRHMHWAEFLVYYPFALYLGRQ